MGTFLLVAGEENVVCIHHWCPEWKEALADGENLGFVHDEEDPSASCASADSIHFKIAATSFVCHQEGNLEPCQSCVDGECRSHACFQASCDTSYCVEDAAGEAMCTDQSPCSSISCEHGCLFGKCLQSAAARGPDDDGDGYSRLADCDDDDADVHPGAMEVFGNDKDDDCDGVVDGSVGSVGQRDGGVDFDPGSLTGNSPNRGDGGPGGGEASPTSGTESDGGCGCRLIGGGGRAPSAAASLGLLAAAALARRRRRSDELAL
jgi:hypothetical protein